MLVVSVPDGKWNTAEFRRPCVPLSCVLLSPLTECDYSVEGVDTGGTFFGW